MSVLLLEAGPDYPDFQHLPEDLKFGYNTRGTDHSPRTFAGHPISLLESRHSWQYVARATDAYPEMPVPRGKVTGGSSAINSSAFYRGDPEDYDHWADLGNDLWSFQELLPSFRKIETDVDFRDDFHGTDGPIFVHHSRREDWHPTQEAFYTACRAARFPDCPDHNNPDSTGVGPGISNNHNRVRFSTALGYLDPSRHRLNLTIRPNCAVQRLLFQGNRAVAALIESGGETFTVEGDQFILSAGAVGSPQLLMLSGVGPASHLEELGIPVTLDSPGVGRNLKDHPKLYATWRIRADYSGGDAQGAGGATLRFLAPGSNTGTTCGLLSRFCHPRIRTLKPRRRRAGAPAQPGREIGLLRPKVAGEPEVDLHRPSVHRRWITTTSENPRTVNGSARVCGQPWNWPSTGKMQEFRRPSGTSSGPGLRRSTRCVDDAGGSDFFPHFRYLQDGTFIGPHGRCGPARSGTWPGGPAGGGRVHHAGPGKRAHQPGHTYDGREDR